MPRATTLACMTSASAAAVLSTCLVTIPDLEPGQVVGADAAAGGASDAGGQDAGGAGGAERSYAEEVMQDFPLGYWRLGEPHGATTAVDEVSPGTPGTYEAVQLAVPGAIAGDTDTAARFSDGSSLDMGDVFGFPGQSEYSLEGWFRPVNIDGHYRRMISKERSDLFVGYSLFVREVDLQIYRKGDGGVDAVWLELPDPRLGASAYAHVVTTYDGSQMCLYVNGSLAGNCRDGTLSIPANSGHFGVSEGWDSFNGDIDEVAIYDHPLTPERIAAHFRAGAP